MAQDRDIPMAGTPTGATTLLEAIGRLRDMGYGGDLFITEEGMVRCGSCHHDTAPEALDLRHLVRLEGASDPSDEAAVLALVCRECGAQGTAIVRYGPEASPQDAEVLRVVEDHRLD
jgi:hypothetical protein